nr:pyridoxamine 5'-phosphate oxidase family protein [Burkholderia guangdongensis]
MLHRCASGTLGTIARDPQGYPYPSVVPYALDARHRPVILVSSLAEHTRNLVADPRAGFFVVDAPDGDVRDAERATLLGRIARLSADDPHLVARYLRYEPDGERYLALGDFSFWVLDVERLRYIGGFGRMGWVDGAALDPLAPLGFDDERALWNAYDTAPRPGLDLLGVDRYGADWRHAGRRVRTAFDAPQADAAALRALLDACARRIA